MRRIFKLFTSSVSRMLVIIPLVLLLSAGVAAAQNEDMHFPGSDWLLLASAREDNGDGDSNVDGDVDTDSDGDTDLSPVSESPVSESPVSESPVDDSPVDDSPVSDSPVSDSPVSDSPVSDSPVDD